MKNTSKQSYKECKESGYMTKKQKEVYDTLKGYGGLTAAEVNKITKSTSNHKRLSELQDKGLVMTCGERWDEDTRKMVTIWDIAPVGYIPQEQAKKPTKATLEALLALYEDHKIISEHYNNGYISGWTACFNSLQGAVPVRFCVPPKDWE